MKIPDKVKVGPFDFKVLRNCSWKESQQAGFCDFTEAEIRIAKVDGGGRPLSSQREWEVFIHEVNHAIDFVYNQQRVMNKERGGEDTIIAFGMGWAQVLQDNDFG